MPLLQACLNGRAHSGVPSTPAELAAAAVGAVAAGAGDIHLHAKDAWGADTLEPVVVAAALQAVRRALQSAGVEGIGIGVTTGAWSSPGSSARLAAVRNWTVLPDTAAVNWHEEGAEELAAALLDRGVGVEAGLWTPAAASAYAASPLAPRCTRMLLEVLGPGHGTPVQRAVHLLDLVGAADGLPPVLLHAERDGVWDVLDVAVRHGLDTRIGLEDAQSLPDGLPPTDNAALVAAAVTRGAGRHAERD